MKVKKRHLAPPLVYWVSTQLQLGPGIGDVFYLANAASAAETWAKRMGADTDHIFTTVNAAVAKCVADRNDKIIALPGYTETIAAAGGITLGTAGVELVGVGMGVNTPIITFSATDSTLLATGANVGISGMQFQNAKDALVSGIVVSAAGFSLKGCQFTQPTSTNDALIWIITSAGADDMVIQGNDFRQSHAGPTECIRLVGADRAKILDNFIIGNYSTAAINGITTASLEILIARNTICNGDTDKLAIDLVVNCTGRIEYNSGTVVSTGSTSDLAIIDAAKCQLAENYFSDTDRQTGKLIGTVSA